MLLLSPFFAGLGCALSYICLRETSWREEERRGREEE
jgi:hypothetical protein